MGLGFAPPSIPLARATEQQEAPAASSDVVVPKEEKEKGEEIRNDKLAWEMDEASSIVEEVWEVVDKHFLDARGGGYSSERWFELRQEALDQLRKSKSSFSLPAVFGGKGSSTTTANPTNSRRVGGGTVRPGKVRKIAKQMLKKGIPRGDPYTR